MVKMVSGYEVVSDGSTWRVPSVGEDDVRLSGDVRWCQMNLQGRSVRW